MTARVSRLRDLQEPIFQIADERCPELRSPLTEWDQSTGASKLSYTATYYDEQGRVIETDTNINPATNTPGLRTGTVYYPDGSVEYTGVLAATGATPPAGVTVAPTGGNVATNDGVATFSFNPGNFVSKTTYLYRQWNPNVPDTNGLFYDETIDPDGNATETYDGYAESHGYWVQLVVNPDQTVSVTVTDNPLIGNHGALGSNVTIPLGGTETEKTTWSSLADPTDTPPTYSIYDRNGNLTDVFTPLAHWRTGYDLSGDQISESDPRTNYGGSTPDLTYTTLYWFDESGNKVREQLPDGEYETWTYNQYGQMATFTDFDGNEAMYTYYTATNTSTNIAGIHDGMRRKRVSLLVFPSSGAERGSLLDSRKPLRRQRNLTGRSPFGGSKGSGVNFR